MTPTISLAMIVRNEEARLSRCLDSVRNAVDEIIIVDTGSTDATVEIARRYTEKVYHYRWNDDFSAARNFAINHAGCRWVLSLDADEELDTTRGDLYTLIKNNPDYEAFFMPLHNQADPSSGSYSRFTVLRLFRHLPGYRFQGHIHEQVVVARPQAVGIAEEPVIRHRPASGQERNRKRHRNLYLLRRSLAAEPGNPFLQYYLGVEWLGLGRAKQALGCFRTAREELTDEHILFRAPAVLYVINCLQITGEIDQAICICLEECNRYPLFTDLFFQGGVLFEIQGEYTIAVKWFKEALNCGQPPAIFSHTYGAGSFLALYHLGYCHEKLGRPQEASAYYEQALEPNPDYIYPLYNLFLLHYNARGPQGAFDWLTAAGHLRQPRRAGAVAELFWIAGYPDLAKACLENYSPDAGYSSFSRTRLLVRLHLYTGRPGEALTLIDSIRDSIRRTGPEMASELAVDEIIALLLQESYQAAKSKALSLWRRPRDRSSAWVLLNLVSLAQNNSWSGQPEPHREQEVIQTALEILENCSRCRPGRYGTESSRVTRNYNRLANSVTQLLTRLSPGGYTALAAYYRDKANDLRQIMEHKYRRAGGLFHA